jgi:hypothetical protein
MGQYGRFFDDNLPFTIPILDDRLNKLRATQISYGHNGYVLMASIANPKLEFLSRAQIVKEYYTMQSLTAEWSGATVDSIRYRQASAGSPWLTVTQALNLGTFDFKNPVIKVQWANGLDMIINHGAQNVNALGHTIPPHGWVALNPATGYENKSVIDPGTGTRVDIVRSTDYEMADGNGVAFTPGGILGTTLNLKVVNTKHGKTIIEEPNTKIVVN